MTPVRTEKDFFHDYLSIRHKDNTSLKGSAKSRNRSPIYLEDVLDYLCPSEDEDSSDAPTKYLPESCMS